MLTGRVQITQHAAERYVKRIDGSLSSREAMALLEQLAPTAAPLKKKTIMGQEQWKLEHPFPCVLVVKRDGGATPPVVVTVWDAPPAEEDEQGEVDRIVALQAFETRAHKPRRVRTRTRVR